MSIKLDASLETTISKQPSEPTLNDVDGKDLGDHLHSVNPGCADVVGIEARVELVDENPTVPVHCKVHAWWH